MDTKILGLKGKSFQTIISVFLSGILVLGGFFLYKPAASGKTLVGISSSSSSNRKSATTDPVYVTIFSHNEAGSYWETLKSDKTAYLSYRKFLIERVKLIKKYGATLNWETDYMVLQAMQNYETGSILKATNNKNILRWMKEDMGVVIDPHGHLFGYNYADIAYMIKQLGVEPSGVVGGFSLYICGPRNADGTFQQEDPNTVLSMDDSGNITGEHYPSAKWQATILAQPAMRGHTYDEMSSGVWRPSLDGNFLKHNSNGKLITVGQGYPHYSDLLNYAGSGEGKNSGGATIWYKQAGYIKELVDKISTGKLSSGKIYTASISIRDYSSETSNTDLENTLKTLKDLKKSGKIVYMDYENVAKTWKNTYKGVANRVDISNFSIYNQMMSDVNTLCKK